MLQKVLAESQANQVERHSKKYQLNCLIPAATIFYSVYYGLLTNLAKKFEKPLCKKTLEGYIALSQSDYQLDERHLELARLCNALIEPILAVAVFRKHFD